MSRLGGKNMDLNEEMYWFWLNNIEGIGRRGMEILLEHYGGPREIFHLQESELKRVLSQKVVACLLYSRNTDKILEKYEVLESKGVRFLSVNHKLYPQKLKNIFDYPYGVYVKGRLPDPLKKSIAIVGARMATSYGREMARFFARELAKADVEVISGLARGIDSIAHMGALEGNGYTMGVLGCGINLCYPKEHIELYMKMEKEAGILSEYGVDVPPNPGFFPMRNRIISGLSDGVFIVEAKEKSGSLITADLGLEQGRDIFVLPGRNIDPLSAGCNNLIKLGAKLVTEPKDILDELGVYTKKNVNYLENRNKLLDLQQKMVYSCLSLEPKYIDSIVKETKLSVQEIISVLFVLEMKDFIKQVVKNYYIVSV